MHSREDTDQDGPCGRCHTCGQKLKENRAGEEQCPSCGKVRKYISHGWLKGETSACPSGKALKKLLARAGGEDRAPASVRTEDRPSDVPAQQEPVARKSRTSRVPRKGLRANATEAKAPRKGRTKKATRERSNARPARKTVQRAAQRARKRGRYSEAQKRDLLAKLQDLRQAGSSIAAASEKLGVTQLTLSRWLKAGKGRGAAPKRAGRRSGRAGRAIVPATPASDVYVVMTADGYRIEGPLSEAFLRVLKGL